MMADDSALVVCPDCHTLNRAADEKCLHCKLPLAWMKQSPLFRETMEVSRVVSQVGVWQLELQVTAKWPGGSGQTKLTARHDSRLDWPLPTGQQVTLSVQSGYGSATVTCGEQSMNLRLPCRDQEFLEGVSLTARYVIVDGELKHSPEKLQTFCPHPVPKAAQVTIGRINQNDLPLPHTSVEPLHAMLVVQTPENDCRPCHWLADCGAKTGTFVNRHRVLAKRLQAGDFIQIGPFAWVYSAEDERLLPEERIDGVAVRLCHVKAATDHFVEPLNGTIRSGEFVAITGKKGSGKSTLLKILSGKPGARKSGQMLIGEDGHWWDSEESCANFRALLGFVSQDSILHEKLKPVQVVAYSARFRGQALDGDDPTIQLRKFELSAADCQKAIKDLSGGENKLVRTAAELVARPRLLLMDEPDSGLDAETRRTLLKHLRRISYQGCTVVVITHGSAEISELAEDGFDRVIRVEKVTIDQVEKGRIALDQQLNTLEEPSSAVEPHRFTTTAESHELSRLGPPQKPVRESGITAQWRQLVVREFALCGAVRLPVRKLLKKVLPRRWQVQVESPFMAWLRWLEFPLRPVAALTVAMIFAAVLAVAVPKDDRHLLDFLSVISVLWMSSSLSLLEIVGERAVFDHEQHLFLKLPAYIGAKLTSNFILAAIQAVTFFAFLEFLRSCVFGDSPIRTAAQDILSKPAGMGLLALMLIAAVGVAMGLTISALANRQKELASFILPLVMIAQIVFSVPITQDNEGRNELLKAYRKFNVQRCAMAPACGNWVESWEPLKLKRATSDKSQGHKFRVRLGLCNRCNSLSEEEAGAREISSSDELCVLVRQRLRDDLRDQTVPFVSVWPSRVTAMLSELTVSRHGDIILRGLHDHMPEAASSLVEPNLENLPKQEMERGAWALLTVEFAALVFATLGILCWQTRTLFSNAGFPNQFKWRSAIGDDNRGTVV